MKIIGDKVYTSKYYQLYVDKTLMLAETLIIKSTDTVSGLNQYVMDQAALTGTPVVNMQQPNTWKYYLNISGEYHYLDLPMRIVSLDTLQEIDFTKENLLMHVATSKGYQFGSRLYKLLVSQYPNQEMLIKGILYPVDINAAIAAQDGKILGYPTGLVEVNEYSLIAKMQKWIYGYKARWTNQQFGVSDTLYPATALGIMYLNLVPVILNLRLEACKTNEVHSFHIQQYLASHGMLNKYIDNMTTKQALFFYRNIAYIERNSGRKETFDWLVENVMTARNLPLAEYLMKHDISNQPSNIYPNLVFYKNTLNGGYEADTGTIFNLEEMLTKEDNSANGNVLYKEEALLTIKEIMENSRSSTVLTKVLESSIIDTTDSSPHSMTETLLNHWIWLSSNGNYIAYITVLNPKTGETISLTAKDAFVLAWFVFCNSIGIDVIDIPNMFAKHVQRIVPNHLNSIGKITNVVSIEDMLSVVDTTLVTVVDAEAAISIQPIIGSIISTQAFYSLCTNIYNSTQLQRGLVSKEQLSVSRAMKECMVSRIYSDNVCSMAPAGQTYSEWFNARSMDISGLSTAELNSMYIELVQQATGISLNTLNSLKSMQEAMINILTQLSSYSIQLIGSINSNNMRKTDWTAVRLNSANGSNESFNRVQDLASGINSVSCKTESSITSRLGIGSDINSIKNIVSDSFKITITPAITSERIKLTTNMRTEIMGTFTFQRTPQTYNARGMVPVMGLANYLNLTPEQWNTFKDIWN